MQTAPLHKALTLGDRIASKVSRPAGRKGTVIRLFHAEPGTGWQWYHVVFDSTPELVHQARRDSMRVVRKTTYYKSGRHKTGPERIKPADLPPVSKFYLS